MKILLLVLLSLPAFAANIPISVFSRTNTQVVLTYICPTAICTLKVSESPSFAPVVYDVDGTLYPGSDSDATNPSVIKNGRQRFWPVGKSNSVGVDISVSIDSGGLRRSHALQVATAHYAKVESYPGGADSGTVSFVTKNIPFGNTHVQNLPVEGFTGKWLQPDFSFTDRTQKVIDPVTGVLLGRTEMMRDAVQTRNDDNDTGLPITYWKLLSPTGAAWTNPANIGSAGTSVDPDDGLYATYNGSAQDVLTLSGNPYSIINHAYANSLDFIAVKLRGFGDAASAALRTVQACFAVLPSPTVCVSNIVDFILPQTTAGNVYYNQSLTLGDYMGWDNPNINRLVDDGNVRLLLWKKATSGSDMISLDSAKVYWGQSQYASPTSAAFHDMCGRIDSGGWMKCILASNLYAVHSVTGEVKHMGIVTIINSVLSLTIPDLKAISATNCITLGVSSRLFDATDPNLFYCNAQLANGKAGILRITLDVTNTAVAQNVAFNYSNPLLLTPIGSDLSTLIEAFDPLVLRHMNCGGDAIQKNTMFGSCPAKDQNSYSHLFVFSFGNGTAMNHASCGTITAGRCSNSGVGIMGVNRVYANPAWRFTTSHTIKSSGDTDTYSWEGGGYSVDSPYGDHPLMTALSADIDATQTTINVTSAWSTAPVTPAGTVHTGDGNFGDGQVAGTGTTFNTSTTVGDTICVAGQCRVITNIDRNDFLYTDLPFSPNITSEQPWTTQLPATPSGFAPGEPVGIRFPRWIDQARPGDWFLAEYYTPTAKVGCDENGEHCGPRQELMILRSKNSSSQWVVDRGCSIVVNVPCTGTGLTHASGVYLAARGNVPTDALTETGSGSYWNPYLDPHATDTNANNPAALDPDNNGRHNTVRPVDPHGISGGHSSQRGWINVYANYFGSVNPGGIDNLDWLTKPASWYIPYETTFAGKWSNASGNTYQRHPGNMHNRWCSTPGCLFFMDTPQFVGGGAFVSASGPATQVEGTVYMAPIGVGTVNPPFGLDRKHLPTVALCGKTPLIDISGPGSHITAATPNSFCDPMNAGECRNSGDVGGASVASNGTYVYVNCPKIYLPYCTGSEAYQGTDDVCVGNQLFDGSSTSQYAVKVPVLPTDVNHLAATRSRPVVKLGSNPRALDGYANAKTTEPGADGTIFAFVPTKTNVSNETLIAKLPPLANLDSVPRNDFIQVAVDVNPPRGIGANKVTVRFGYDRSFYCTQRAEACVSAASNNPFFYEGETYSGVSCASGCRVNVPSYPNRLLFYQVEYRTAGDVLIQRGPLQIQEVP